MSKLTDIYATVENQLQWGPALDPFFKELIAEIDLINQKLGTAQPTGSAVDSEARQAITETHNTMIDLKEKMTLLMESHDQMKNALISLTSPPPTPQTDTALSSTTTPVQTGS